MTPKKPEEDSGLIKESPLLTGSENRLSFGEKHEAVMSFGGSQKSEKDVVYVEKVMENQVNLQKNMEKYEEILNMNHELKKEKEEVIFEKSFSSFHHLLCSKECN